MAIAHAQTILSWQENLPREEMPPRWMWPFDDELEVWFTEVERKRKEKWGLRDDDDEPAEMMSNELARSRRGR